MIFRSVYLVLLEGNANINGEQFEAVDTAKVLKKAFENQRFFHYLLMMLLGFNTKDKS